MKIYNITIPRKYTHKGEEKTKWNTVGRLVHFPASGDKEEGYRELDMFPDTNFYVFEAKPRDEHDQTPPSDSGSQEVDSNINPDDIPF